jgi:hypothetical protein
MPVRLNANARLRATGEIGLLGCMGGVFAASLHAGFFQCSQPRRDGRVVEGARLESVFRGNSNVGSNPTLSAILFSIRYR